ncbi:MAG: PhnE/PtxC family ABC transporter permease, partial [Burkholderiaceae bacterium]
FFVRVGGLGPAGGVLAIAVTYTGMLGKIYGEILECGDTQASRAVLIGGGSRLQAFFYGLLPQNATEISSYTVYRWECAIRSSAVLGFVGAGGLGQQIDASMKMFNGGEVATILIVLMVLVAIADLMSAFIRKAIQ